MRFWYLAGFLPVISLKINSIKICKDFKFLKHFYVELMRTKHNSVCLIIIINNIDLIIIYDLFFHFQ